MFTKKAFIVVLAATSCLTAGFAVADQATQAPANSAPQQATLAGDAGKLSVDGSRAFNDIALTRLAIFDGRADDARTFVNEADKDFGKARTDETVFTKAEADFKSPEVSGAKTGGPNDTAASNPAPASQMAANQYADNAKAAGIGTPKQWLPVDGEMILNEDFTANPAKTAAVTDANKSLAKGDRKGAIETLKLADVDVDYIVAVVPLDQTIKDVHQAATLINDGKFYEASQMLRHVQDSARYDMLDVTSGTTKTGATTRMPAAKDPGGAAR